MTNTKFRARTTGDDNRPPKWVYGNYFESPLTEENFKMDAKDGAFFAVGKKRHCIQTEHGVAWEIHPETLGQCTGLKDVNEVEIYQGDCVELEGEVHEVIYNKSSAAFVHGGIIGAGLALSMPFQDWDDFKVVGNVHENPELFGN